MKDEKWCLQTLKRISNELALGSGRTEDFRWGMIRGWFAAGLITRQFYCELADTFATDSSSESDQKGLQEKHGRVLQCI